MTTMTKTKKERFEIAPEFLYTAILNQAGSLQKAILEGIMNSVDAGATRCDIIIEADRVVITDNGKGMMTKAEIDLWFKRFGQPHEESENKRFGRFRMGRGQMFAYGVNDWRTGKNILYVDIKNDGMNYSYSRGDSNVKGCQITIDLYDSLQDYEINYTVSEISKWVMYLDMPVYVNGKLISQTKVEAWTLDTENFQFKEFTDTALRVYNMGVLVREFYSGDLGVSGDLVFKKAIAVNFARNDILSTCPIWKAAKEQLQETSYKLLLQKTRFNLEERKFLLEKVYYGQLSPKLIQDKKLLETVNGQLFSPAQLLKKNLPVSETAYGSAIGEKIHQKGLAVVLSDRCVYRFGSVDSLLDKFGLDTKLKSVDFEVLKSGFSCEYQLYDEKDCSEREERFLGAMREAWWQLRWGYCESRGQDWQNTRRLYIGSGDAIAWTDGSTYIAFDRKAVRDMPNTFAGVSEMVLALLHEYCHVEVTVGRHDHTLEFYSEYHEHSFKAPAAQVAAFKHFSKHMKRTQQDQLVLEGSDDQHSVAGAASESAVCGDRVGVLD